MYLLKHTKTNVNIYLSDRNVYAFSKQSIVFSLNFFSTCVIYNEM